MTLALALPAAALVALGLKVAHDKREHDRALYQERERFVAYSDRYAHEWEQMR